MNELSFQEKQNGQTREKTSLKNGYYVEHFIHKTKYDTLQSLALTREGGIIKEINTLGVAAPYSNLGFVEADFDSLFAFVTCYGGGNPHELLLIQKKDGKIIKSGFFVSAMPTENILIYQDPSFDTFLFDIKNNKEWYIETNEVPCLLSFIRDCIEIAFVSEKQIELHISTEKRTLIKKYIRKL